MLSKIKTALRISHSYLDADITDTINSARAELIRSGVSSEVANDATNPVILEAIKTYCKMVYAKDTATGEAFSKSWEYQQDCLRKSNFSVPYIPSSDDTDSDESEGDDDV